MDSRLLNVFHDDPFDDGYLKYENEAGYWPSNNENLNIQLSETLHGILPIAANESVTSDLIYTNEYNYNDEFAPIVQNNHESGNHMLHTEFGLQQLTAGDDYEIITVDPNTIDCDTDDDESNTLPEVDVSNLFGEDAEGRPILDDEHSQLSYATFRSRTDSSSIGDYESHSSDYDDDEAEFEETVNTQDDCEAPAAVTNITNCLLKSDKSIFDTSFELPLDALEDDDKKNFSFTSISSSDIDKLIDPNNFDLAEFITKDDYTLNPNEVIVGQCNKSDTIAEKPTADSDSESDIIVDVETVELEEEQKKVTWMIANVEEVSSSSGRNKESVEDDVPFVDNVKSDPIWCPTYGTKKAEKNTNQFKTTQSSSSTQQKVQPNCKKQKEKTKNKKNTTAAKQNSLLKAIKSNSKITKKFVEKKQKPTSIARTIPKVGIGQGGKNLSMLRMQAAEDKEKRAVPKVQVVEQKQEKEPDLLKKIVIKEENSLPEQQTDLPLIQRPLVPQKSVEIRTEIQTTAQQKNVKTKAQNQQLVQTQVKVESVLAQTELKKEIEIETETETTIAPQTEIKVKTETTASPIPKIIPVTVPSVPQAKTTETPAETLKPSTDTNAHAVATNVPLIETSVSFPITTKRKLNLEEYKRRRSGLNVNSLPTLGKVPKIENIAPDFSQKIDNSSAVVLPKIVPTIAHKHSEAVTAVVRSLKIEKSMPTDPITEAKNKVLRMQQLKRQQQLKIIDSAIAAKVPRVTKLLPLKEIVKGTCYAEAAGNDNWKYEPEFKDVPIVSASCNTDISIPPKTLLMAHKQLNAISSASNLSATKQFSIPQLSDERSRSLLKSSVLLYKASKTPANSNNEGKVNSLSNTLIASIQDVVVKQPTTSEKSNCNSNAVEGYAGEGLVTVLRKSNKVPKMVDTVETQTSFLPEFPPLSLLKIPAQHKSRERMRAKRNYRQRSLSPNKTVEESTETSVQSNGFVTLDAPQSQPAFLGNQSSNNVSINRSRSRSRTIDSCASISSGGCSLVEDGRLNTGEVTTGGYSSHSSRRHRSSISSSYSECERDIARRNRRQRKTSYKQRSSRRHSRTRSSSRSSTNSDYSDRSRSRGRSRSRSKSPYFGNQRSISRSNHRNQNYAVQVSQPAVEERRIVYVGRIEQETTKEMLRHRFLAYGNIKQISIHHKETGMKYGFVTFERSQDAFRVIDNSSKDPMINMYDISFGGRRAFCRQSYADLDNAGINTYQSYVFPQSAPAAKKEDSFEALLQQVKAKMTANKSTKM